MTHHSHKKYIITDEQLEIIEDKSTNSYGDCMIPEEVLVAIRSRPYTAASGRERVLDMGIEAIQRRIDGIFEAYRGEIDERKTDHAYTMANGMGEAINILRELRKQEGQR